MKFHPLLPLTGAVLVTMALSGCDTGGEYNAPASSAKQTKSTAASTCSSVSVKTSDAQKATDSKFNYDYSNAFLAAFLQGNDLFERSFTAAEGGGANVGGHERYTRVPRADHACSGEWAKHVPDRATGPNAQSCLDCHSHPNDGAGSNAGNAQRDPLHSGKIDQFIQRNTPHLFGGGALQLLAEDMTAELQKIKTQAGVEACKSGKSLSHALTAKTVSYGVIKASCLNGKPQYDLSGVKGIMSDLVVRPFQWKKSMLSVRDFVLDAAHNEIGMQAVELPGLGPNVDGDGDGVVNELTVSQITALTVYMAAQPRPVSRVEFTDWGIADQPKFQKVEFPFETVTIEERAKIKQGETVFMNTGCAECHKPQLSLDKVRGIFKEAKGNQGVVSFDITKGAKEQNGIPDNMEINLAGDTLGQFKETDSDGNIVIRLFGDLKQHDMGPELAEAIDEPVDKTDPKHPKGKGIGRSTFGTKELWGVACTGPWLHDGRATTLTEAIRYHGGEAASSRSRFDQLDAGAKANLFAFLYNQVLYLHETGEDMPNQRGVCGKAEDELVRG